MCTTVPILSETVVSTENSWGVPHGAYLISLLEFCQILAIKENIIMRKQYQEILQTFFHHRLYYTRVDILDITQEEMAYRLALSCRSYVDLDHGKTSCSAVTLALFLVYICHDPAEFLEELRYAFEAVRTTTAWALLCSCGFLPHPTASYGSCDILQWKRILCLSSLWQLAGERIHAVLWPLWTASRLGTPWLRQSCSGTEKKAGQQYVHNQTVNVKPGPVLCVS